MRRTTLLCRPWSKMPDPSSVPLNQRQRRAAGEQQSRTGRSGAENHRPAGKGTRPAPTETGAGRQRCVLQRVGKRLQPAARSTGRPAAGTPDSGRPVRHSEDVAGRLPAAHAGRRRHRRPGRKDDEIARRIDHHLAGSHGNTLQMWSEYRTEICEMKDALGAGHHR